jgi:hypothetical protein
MLTEPTPHGAPAAPATPAAPAVAPHGAAVRGALTAPGAAAVDPAARSGWPGFRARKKPPATSAGTASAAHKYRPRLLGLRPGRLAPLTPLAGVASLASPAPLAGVAPLAGLAWLFRSGW